MALRLSRWGATVSALAAVGLAGGALFGVAMEGFSPDYPAVGSEHGLLGLKLGLVAGTVLGACQVVGERPPPSTPRTAVAIALLGLLAIGTTGLVFALLSIDALRESYAEWVLRIRLDRLANPGRYVVYRGLNHAVVFGALLGAAVAGAYLWRGRRGTES